MAANTEYMQINGHGSSIKCNVRTQIDIPIYNGRYIGSFHSFNGLVDGQEHLAIGLGDWQVTKEHLIRLHSECLTGDLFGSQKCDCGNQLRESVEKIHEHGGFILYLRQEGRGIGLYNKLDAYQLQQQHGMNTYQANHALGFADDLRDYSAAWQMLLALGVKKTRLLSNNPDKLRQLRKLGVNITGCEKTGVYCNQHNRDYLTAKADVSGHALRVKRNNYDSA